MLLALLRVAYDIYVAVQYSGRASKSKWKVFESLIPGMR